MQTADKIKAWRSHILKLNIKCSGGYPKQVLSLRFVDMSGFCPDSLDMSRKAGITITEQTTKQNSDMLFVVSLKSSLRYREDGVTP